MEIDKTQCKWKCKHRESRRKVTILGEVAFGFEPSFVKDYRIYWLINEHNFFELSVVCVYRDNRIHTARSYSFVHFGPKHILVNSWSALENLALKLSWKRPTSHSYRWLLLRISCYTPLGFPRFKNHRNGLEMLSPYSYILYHFLCGTQWFSSL